MSVFFFFFNDTATTEIYTLSLHDALPISPHLRCRRRQSDCRTKHEQAIPTHQCQPGTGVPHQNQRESRERADSKEQIVEALIEREQSCSLRVLGGLAKPCTYFRAGPPEAFHAEDQDVN